MGFSGHFFGIFFIFFCFVVAIFDLVHLPDLLKASGFFLNTCMSVVRETKNRKDVHILLA